MKRSQTDYTDLINRLMNLIILWLSLNIDISAQTPAENRWFVDNNATGLNNGTSWANAWSSFNSINWGLIQPGATIYISGGSIEKTYFETLSIGTSGSLKNMITIRAGLEEGHNGRVVINGGKIRNGIVLVGKSNIRFIKLNVISCNSGIEIKDLNNSVQAKNIFIDSCTVLDNYDQAAVFIDGYPTLGLVDSIYIRWGEFSSTSDAINKQTDVIYVQYAGYVHIEGNTIKQLNRIAPSQGRTDNLVHADCFQVSHGIRRLLFANNYLFNNRILEFNTSDSMYVQPDNAIIYSGVVDTALFYNNVVYFKDSKNWSKAFFLTEPGGTHIIVNNTFLSGKSGQTISLAGGDITFINNLVQTTLTPNYSIFEYTGFPTDWAKISNNAYGNNLNSTIFRGVTGNISLSTLRSNYSGEINSFGNLDPDFINISSENFRLGTNSQAKDIGKDMSDLINRWGLQWKDFEGKNRSSITSAGAFEYVLANDNESPRLINAVLLDSISLELEFSEELDTSETLNLLNYSINNGITVQSLKFNLNKVILTTSIHIPGTYTVTVHNIEDTAGNLISKSFNSMTYSYYNNAGTIQFIPISVIASSSPLPDLLPNKTIDGKGLNSGDSNSRWASRPMPEWIAYDFGKQILLNKFRLSFNNWENGRIYNFAVYSSVDSTIWYTISENLISTLNEEWSTFTIDPIDLRFVKIVFLSNNQNEWAGLWEAEFYGHYKLSTGYENEKINTFPSECVLFQNYPNPFNPTTKISWYSPIGSWHTLKVYDLLGNEVTTLVNEFIDFGLHEVEFNAENLASGIYIYRIQTETLKETKKMILLR